MESLLLLYLCHLYTVPLGVPPLDVYSTKLISSVHRYYLHYHIPNSLTIAHPLYSSLSVYDLLDPTKKW